MSSVPTGLTTAGMHREHLAKTISLLGVVLVLALLLWPSIRHAAHLWATVGEFSYGFLVPPAAALLVWRQRQALRRHGARGATGGLLIVIAALALYLLAQRMSIEAVAGVAISPLLWGSIVYLWGWGIGRLLAFPVAFLAFGFGIAGGVLNSVGFWLQGITARGAATLGQALGLAVSRDGLILQSERFAFVVAEPCSGMSSLLSLLALAAVWVHLVPGPWPGRLLVLLSVGPVVVWANIARVTLVLGIAAHFGQDAAMGFFHSASSLVVFGLACGGLLGVSWVVGCRAPRLAVSCS